MQPSPQTFKFNGRAEPLQSCNKDDVNDFASAATRRRQSDVSAEQAQHYYLSACVQENAAAAAAIIQVSFDEARRSTTKPLELSALSEILSNLLL